MIKAPSSVWKIEKIYAILLLHLVACASVPLSKEEGMRNNENASSTSIHQRKRRGNQLYQYFKSGKIPSDTTDRSFAGPEEKSIVQLWKQPHFQGDIAKVDQAQMQRLFNSKQRLAAVSPNWVWPSHVIPIEIPFWMFNDQQFEIIQTALDRIQMETCVQFRWRSDDDTEYITFAYVPEFGCSSYGIGRQFHVNAVNLFTGDGGSCFSDWNVMHELLHAVGLHHEHSRFDRDNYIKINWSNVDPSQNDSFRILDSPNFGVYGLPYDYESITHYDQFAFGKDGKETIQTRDAAYQNEIGRIPVMSEGDRKKVNRMFGCPDPLPRTWDPYFRSPEWPRI